MAHSDPIAMMQRETELREGDVPTEWKGADVNPGEYVLDNDVLLFRAPNGPDFLYRRGQGVMMQCANDAARSEADLWFSGSVYSAIAAINELIPLHASAVEVNGEVFAITGATGAGKSTLAAALAMEGMPLFCDDTLLVIPQRNGRALCLPGHKRLKLDQAAAELVGAELRERVSGSTAKRFADVPRSSRTGLIPLSTLIVLRESQPVQIADISAGEAIAALLQDHYTVEFSQLAMGGDNAQYWRKLTGVTHNVQCVEFARTKEPNQFRSILSELRSFLVEREGL